MQPPGDLLGTACLALCLQSATQIIQIIPAFFFSFLPHVVVVVVVVTSSDHKCKNIFFFPEIRTAEGSDNHGGEKTRTIVDDVTFTS